MLCPPCKSKGHTSKQEKIANTHKYLFAAFVTSELQLSLMSFFSVFIHLSQDDAGHYITIRKDKDQWLMFDDDDGTEIQISRADR